MKVQWPEGAAGKEFNWPDHYTSLGVEQPHQIARFSVAWWMISSDRFGSLCGYLTWHRKSHVEATLLVFYTFAFNEIGHLANPMCLPFHPAERQDAKRQSPTVLSIGCWARQFGTYSIQFLLESIDKTAYLDPSSTNLFFSNHFAFCNHPCMSFTLEHVHWPVSKQEWVVPEFERLDNAFWKICCNSRELLAL